MCMIAVQTSSVDNILQFLSALFIFVFVLGITYLTSRWIAGYQKEHSMNKNLKVIETLKITPNKYIQLIEAGEEYLVVAIGKEEVQLLTKLRREQLKDLSFENEMTKLSTDNFKDVLDKVKKHIPKK